MRVVAGLADRHAVAVIEEQRRVALVVPLMMDHRRVRLISLADQ
jgi:hypothetical protein